MLDSSPKTRSRRRRSGWVSTPMTNRASMVASGELKRDGARLPLLRPTATAAWYLRIDRQPAPVWPRWPSCSHVLAEMTQPPEEESSSGGGCGCGCAGQYQTLVQPPGHFTPAMPPPEGSLWAQWAHRRLASCGKRAHTKTSPWATVSPTSRSRLARTSRPLPSLSPITTLGLTSPPSIVLCCTNVTFSGGAGQTFCLDQNFTTLVASSFLTIQRHQTFMSRG